MSIISKILGIPKNELRTIEATDSRTMIKTADGVTTTSEVGKRYVVKENDAITLVQQGSAKWVHSAEAQAEIDRLNSIVPPPVEPRPVPDSLASLPKCFAELWQLHERLRCLKARQVGIEAVYLRGHGLTDREKCHFQQDSAFPHPAALRREIIDKWVQRMEINVQFRDPAEIRKSSDALVRIGQDIDEFKDANRKRILELRYECSNHVLDTYHEARELAEELPQVALEIFKTRIGALGLGEGKIIELFGGSADRANYLVARPSIRGLEVFGNDDETGETVSIVNASVEHLARQLFDFKEKSESYAKLLKQAKAELKKAREASGPQLALPS